MKPILFASLENALSNRTIKLVVNDISLTERVTVDQGTKSGRSKTNG
jgi:hypothetical protein